MQHVPWRGRSFVGVCLLGAVLAAPVRTDATELSFEPVLTEVSCVEARPIDLWIDGTITDLRGASLVMHFDPTVIRPVAVEEGQLLIDDPCPSFLRWNNETVVGDSIFVDVAGLGCSVQGPGPVLRIWVTGVADGSTLLWGSSAILRDSQNAPIPALWTPAHVIVACPVSSGERSWAALKGSYR